MFGPIINTHMDVYGYADRTYNNNDIHMNVSNSLIRQSERYTLTQINELWWHGKYTIKQQFMTHSISIMNMEENENQHEINNKEMNHNNAHHTELPKSLTIVYEMKLKLRAIATEQM